MNTRDGNYGDANDVIRASTSRSSESYPVLTKSSIAPTANWATIIARYVRYCSESKRNAHNMPQINRTQEDARREIQNTIRRDQVVMTTRSQTRHAVGRDVDRRQLKAVFYVAVKWPTALRNVTVTHCYARLTNRANTLTIRLASRLKLYLIIVINRFNALPRSIDN